MFDVIPTIRFRKGAVEIIDQTRLPLHYTLKRIRTVDALCEAIRNLRIRGAPALGIAGAYGLLLSVEAGWGGKKSFFFDDVDEAGSAERIAGFPADARVSDLRRHLDSTLEAIRATRPTAVNLSWALERMASVYRRDWDSPASLLPALGREAFAIFSEDLEMCRALGVHGAALLSDGDSVLTHCNTGGLAASGYGTALGVVFAAVEAGKHVHVYADETRPLLQGARLTAWECVRRRIPVTVLVEGAAGSLLGRGEVSCVIVGADRIARNGDTANKVGTFNMAVLASRFGVPFYIAAPSSTIDARVADGSGIPIEERPADEVTVIGETRIAPEETLVYNPAFDVTPHALITAIITEKGVFRPPFDFSKEGG